MNGPETAARQGRSADLEAIRARQLNAIRARQAAGLPAPVDSIDNAAAVVAKLERDLAEGRPIDRARVAEVRAFLARRTPGDRAKSLAARLHAFGPRSDRLAPRNLKEHRAALAALEVELGALAGGKIPEAARAPLREWLERELAAEAAALDAKGYGASGESLGDRMTILLARAQRLGLGTPYGPDNWMSGQRKRQEERRREEEWKRQSEEWRSSDEETGRRFRFTFPLRPSIDEERDALAHELGLDLTAPADAIKRRVRALAFEAHPDHGGTHGRMVKLNRLRELIEHRASATGVTGP